jgi:hypothetical protein
MSSRFTRYELIGCTVLHRLDLANTKSSRVIQVLRMKSPRIALSPTQNCVAASSPLTCPIPTTPQTNS